MRQELKEIFKRPIHRAIYANLALRVLTGAESKRLEKLIKIYKSLETGKVVQNRQLENWLSPDQFEAMQTDWRRELQSRQDQFGEKPQPLIEYEYKLNEALFAFNRAEHYSGKGKPSSAKKLYSKAEGLFEDALEYLEEQVSIDANLRYWLDRDFDLKHLSPCPAGMPRLITSRSLENKSKVYKKSIRECKIDAVRLAIADLVYDCNVVETKVKESKLESILNTTDDHYDD